MKKSTKQIITEKLENVMNLNKDLFSDDAKKLILETLETKSIQVKEKDGKIYCNYFKMYLPESEMQKVKKGDKEVWESMSIKGKQLRQKELTLTKNRDKKLADLILNDTITDIAGEKAKILKEYEKGMAEIEKAKTKSFK